MGVFACKPFDARRGPQPGGADDPRPTQTRLCAGGGGWVVACLTLATPAFADTRIATFAAPLSRDGPGLLLRDIRKGEDPEIVAILAVVAEVDPDILLLTDFDYDLDRVALQAFADAAGYPHIFAWQPNTGIATGFDIDGNGRLGEARDAMGYGRFTGDGGMAIVSRHPVTGTPRNLTETLWRDLPGAVLPPTSDAIAAIQRLSTAGHWIVPFETDDGIVTLLASAHTPPVFDGPEDRNGLRNRDELRLWSQVLDDPPKGFVIAGNMNLDPVDGQGYADAMAAFLADPRLIDPQPQSAGATFAANPDQRGDPATDTADWTDPLPGNLRVSYVLPSSAWQVTGSGVFWPAPDDPKAALLGADGADAGRHRLVWVDIAR